MMHEQRHGVCHRCGWPGSVSRVGINERRRTGTGHSYGRLCTECLDTLSVRHQTAEPRLAEWGVKLLQRWDVA